MPAGIQIFDQPGNIVIGNYTDNFGRYLGIIWTGNYPSLSYSDSALASGRPWAQASVSAGLFNWDTITKITISGTTIAWNPISGGKHFFILYGVY